MKQYVCGVDIGTSVLKLTFLAGDGSSLGPFQREIETVYPKPLFAEQDPDQWIELLRLAFSDAFATGLVDNRHIAAIIPDAATHTTVLLDGAFHPVRRAILWNDQRSAALAQACKIGETVFKITNHMPGAMWSLFQNMWVKTYEPEVWRRVKHLAFAKDYLRYQLTGVFCTDHIDAQGSQLYDVRARRWSEELCSYLGCSIDMLPPLQNPTDQAGAVTERTAVRLGLRAGTPVYTGTTDTALELLAAGAIRPGQGTIKLATSGRICVAADRAYPHRQLVNYSHIVDGLYYPGTGTRSCATSLRWFQEQFARREADEAAASGKSVYALLDERAAKIPAGADGLFFHPYLLGEFSPYSSEYLRASFTGLSMHHTPAHLARAVLEGIAYSLRDCMELLLKLGIAGGAGEWMLIGGGAKSELWGQIIADVLDRQLSVPAVSDSSFGGAMLAGVACGMFSSIEHAVETCCAVQRTVEPNLPNVEMYHTLFPLYQQIVRALTPVYERLAKETAK